MLSNTLRNICLATAGVFMLAAAPISAATFSFSSEVTTTIGPSAAPGVPSLPPSGTAGKVELVIDDSDPTLAIFDGLDVNIFATVSVDVPGWITGSMTNNPNPSDFFQVSDSHLAFGSYGPTSVATDNGAFVLPNARHSFRIDFGAVAPATPTTIGDLVMALSEPGASGYFSHELEGSAGFIHTRVEFPASTPAVPLPASAWMLLMGLVGLGVMRRRAA